LNIDIPGRIFLDTSCLNFIVENGDYLFDGCEIPEKVTERQYVDLESLYNMFRTGKRAFWQIMVSRTSFGEVWNTSNLKKRMDLKNWVSEIWIYWNELLINSKDIPTSTELDRIIKIWIDSGKLDILPDKTDRFLICEAIAYNCDCFLTRDFKTILKHRDQLKRILSMKILTPYEWWKIISPYARIWG